MKQCEAQLAVPGNAVKTHLKHATVGWKDGNGHTEAVNEQPKRHKEKREKKMTRESVMRREERDKRESIECARHRDIHDAAVIHAMRKRDCDPAAATGEYAHA